MRGVRVSFLNIHKMKDGELHKSVLMKDNVYNINAVHSPPVTADSYYTYLNIFSNTLAYSYDLKR